MEPWQAQAAMYDELRKLLDGLRDVQTAAKVVSMDDYRKRKGGISNVNDRA